ncbi:hypothetical protein HBH92_062980 [Parastagonospora nodorum]|nr:hypothetical protein HBH92_062980 [Parastagonospora nodorum]KAH4424472.1 hypothetical protein HBH93_187780 [Parastagonospora nodorum]KAH4548788.1 hypothetical protein HBH85_056320 [Parastagonospora nodorum]KAH4560979.1 hypothetical protein HBH86_070670 [Parastagonospora nodorum]KAH4857829.1 hypothetical protein HBH75_062860 [Parastagonospora nodorum]
MRSHSICGRARALYHGLSSFYATADRLSVPESQNVSTIKHLSRSGRDFPLPAGVLRVVSGTLCHQLARPRAQAWSPSKLYSITSDGLHQTRRIATYFVEAAARQKLLRSNSHAHYEATTTQKPRISEASATPKAATIPIPPQRRGHNNDNTHPA